MKTVLEWLNTLQEPYKSAAIKLMRHNNKVPDIRGAIRSINYLGNHIRGKSCWYTVMSAPSLFTTISYSKYLKNADIKRS